MDVVSAKWLSKMGMEEYNICNNLDFTSDHDMLEDSLKQSLSIFSDAISASDSVKNNDSQTNFEDTPSKQLKISSTTTGHTVLAKLSSYNSSSSSQILCFDTSNCYPENHHGNLMKRKKEAVDLKFSSHDHVVKRDSQMRREDFDHHYAPTAMKNINKRTYLSMITNPTYAQDHIMAERKRREKLSQGFIALSAIVPGLKKMDKASVLGDAIKYLKELQERVNVLEQQTQKRTMESVVFIKKYQLLSSDDDPSSSNEISDSNPSEEALLPEIEARALDKDVLIRIHCDKQKGLAVKILSELEKLHLFIIHSSVLPFGNSTLDMTIVAQMDSQFDMSVKDLVKNLRLALSNIT